MLYSMRDVPLKEPYSCQSTMTTKRSSAQCIRAVDISSSEDKALSGRLRQFEMDIE